MKVNVTIGSTVVPIAKNFRIFLRENYFFYKKDGKEITSHLKKRILVQDQGGAGFQILNIRQYASGLKPGSNKDIGPKDFFEMVCSKLSQSIY